MTAPALLRLAAVTALAVAGVASGIAAAPAAQDAVPRDAGATSVSAVDSSARVAQAEQARWTGQTVVRARVAAADAEALALAAVDAADAAAAVAGDAAGVSELGDARAAVAALSRAVRAQPYRDPAAPSAGPVAPGAGTVAVARLAVAHDLRAGAEALFASAFAVEAAARTAPPVPIGRSADLEAVEATVAVARQLAGSLDRELAPAAVRRDGLAASGARLALLSPWPNGVIPLDVLCAPRSAPDARLQCEAAGAFDRLAEAYLADTGQPLTIVSSYRSLEEQVVVKRLRGGLAAKPGTSMHGRGLAVDLADTGHLGQYDAPAYLWLKEHAAAYGWYHPRSMEPGGSGPAEPWHWEYAGTARTGG